MSGFVIKVLRAGLGIFTSRVFGMVRDMVIAAFFGATLQTDAFFVAFAVPNLFRAFFAEGALSSVFTPFLSDKLQNEGEKAASDFLTSLILSVGLLILMILGAVMAYPDYLAIAFMPGYSGNTMMVGLASAMLIVLIPYLLFISICALLSCYLNIKGSYYIPGASTAVLNVAMITGAAAGYYDHNIMYLCYGVFIGGILQLSLVLFYTLKAGYRPLPFKNYDKDVNRLFLKIIPSIAGVGINQVNFMIGRIIASYLAVGSISYLYFANRLFQFPLGLFAIAVGTVTLTEISVANSEGHLGVRNKMIDKAINSVMMVMLPAMAGLIVLAEPIIALVYGHRNYTYTAVRATAADLRAYTSGLLFYAFISVLSRIYYSDKNTLTPVIGAGIGLASNLVFNFLFMNRLGHVGIALSSSCAAFLNCSYLFIMVKNYKYRIKNFIVFILKLSCAAAVMSVLVWYAQSIGLHIILVIFLGALAYFLVVKSLGISIKEVLR